MIGGGAKLVPQGTTGICSLIVGPPELIQRHRALNSTAFFVRSRTSRVAAQHVCLGLVALARRDRLAGRSTYSLAVHVLPYEVFLCSTVHIHAR